MIGCVHVCGTCRREGRLYFQTVVVYSVNSANKMSSNLSWVWEEDGYTLSPCIWCSFYSSASQAQLRTSSGKPHPSLFSFAVEITVPYCNFLVTCRSRLSNDTEHIVFSVQRTYFFLWLNQTRGRELSIASGVHYQVPMGRCFSKLPAFARATWVTTVPIEREAPTPPAFHRGCTGWLWISR